MSVRDFALFNEIKSQFEVVSNVLYIIFGCYPKVVNSDQSSTAPDCDLTSEIIGNYVIISYNSYNYILP